MITSEQAREIRDVLRRRVVATEHVERLHERLAAMDLTDDEVVRTLAWLERRPVVSVCDGFNPQTLEIGIYELDGKIYKVRRSNNTNRRYAMVLNYGVRTAKRLTASGETIEAEYVYAPGAILDLRPENRITGQRAEELSIIFRSCIVCSRKLKAAKSVAAGIGPVCAGKV